MRVPGFARGARQFLTHAVRGREPGRVDRHLGLAFTPQRYVRVDAAIFQLQQIRLVAVARIGQYHRRLDPKRLVDLVEHPHQLTLVAGLWPHLSRDDDLVPPIDRHLRAIRISLRSRTTTDIGRGDAAVAALKTGEAVALRLMQMRVLDRDVLSSWYDLIAYCQAKMAHESREHFHILFLDTRNRLIADERQQTGTINHAPVYPREVITRALDLSAAAVILVHNHPSGDPTPSQADIEMTRKIAEAGRTLGVLVHDHLVVARGGYTSYRADGLL